MHNHLFKTTVSSLSLLAVILDASVGIFLLHAALFDRTWLLDTRAAFFSDLLTDRSAFTAAPDQLEQLGFRTDPPDKRDQWRKILGQQVDYANTGFSLQGPTVDRVQGMVLLFSRNGADPTQGQPRCGEYEFSGLLDNLQRIGTDGGYGCCSDHSQAFLALASVAGIDAREVAHSQHVFSEFYSPERSQWIWVDPQYALMAKDPQGRYLSFLELRDRYHSNQHVSFVFFGNEYHVLQGRDPLEHIYYDQPSDFFDYTVTWGNDVFTQEKFRERFEVIPTSARQLLGFLFRSIPGYVVFVDENSVSHRALGDRRRLCITILVALGLTNGFFLFWIRERLLISR